jgi:hypothetical protein
MGTPAGYEGRGAFAALAAWWRRLTGSERPFEAEYLALQEAANASQRLITCEADNVHAQLLTRRMELLQLKPNELARTDPQLFRELQATCLLCEQPDTCAHALRDDSADPAWQDWRNYCPNSTRLTMLSTLKNCD